MQSEKCPLRKTIQVNSAGEYGSVKQERFQDCIGLQCAWFDEDSHCCSICTIAHLLDWYFVEVKEVEK